MSDPRTHTNIGYCLFGYTDGTEWIGANFGKLESAIAAARRHIEQGAEMVSIQEIRTEYTYTWVWNAGERVTPPRPPESPLFTIPRGGIRFPSEPFKWTELEDQP